MPIVDTTKSSLAAVIQEYGRPDIHIGGGEDESPYVPFKENVFIRHLAFDVRTNSFANLSPSARCPSFINRSASSAGAFAGCKRTATCT